jgi:hemerythrin
LNIAWDSKYETGVERIDFEHRIFVGLIKDLHDAVQAGQPRIKLTRIVDEIRLYAAFHFLSEENIMLDNGFPDYAEHRGEHQRLLSLLDDHAHAFSTDASHSGEEIVEFVFEWFALHTTQIDKQIALYIGVD